MKTVESPTSIKDEAFWKQHVESHKASGLTRAAYCRKHKINYDRFGYWLHKWSRKTAPLIAIKLKPSHEVSTQTTLCTLSLGNGKQLLIHDLQVLSMILERMG